MKLRIYQGDQLLRTRDGLASLKEVEEAVNESAGLDLYRGPDPDRWDLVNDDEVLVESWLRKAGDSPPEPIINKNP